MSVNLSVVEGSKDNIVNRFLDMYKSEDTKRGYDCAIRIYFGVSDVGEVTEWMIKKVKLNDVVDWIKGMYEDGKSNATVNKYISALRSLFEYCIDMEIVKDNVFSDRRVDRVKKLNKKNGYDKKGIALTENEMERLLNGIDDDRHKLMVKFMLQTGLRISEILSVKVEDFKEVKGNWFLEYIGKGNKVGFLPVKDETMVEIWDYVEKYEIKGELWDISVWGSSKMLKRYCRKSGVREISNHDTRRTCISQLLENGTDLVKVKKYLNHSSLNTTLGYEREINKFDRSILEKIMW